MLTTALNTLVLIRIGGFRLAHGGGWDGFGPLFIGLAVICVLIGALSRLSGRASAEN
jgi:uncharacterized membrane protein